MEYAPPESRAGRGLKGTQSSRDGLVPLGKNRTDYFCLARFICSRFADPLCSRMVSRSCVDRVFGNHRSRGCGGRLQPKFWAGDVDKPLEEPLVIMAAQRTQLIAPLLGVAPFE